MYILKVYSCSSAKKYLRSTMQGRGNDKRTREVDGFTDNPYAFLCLRPKIIFACQPHYFHYPSCVIACQSLTVSTKEDQKTCLFKT